VFTGTVFIDGFEMKLQGVASTPTLRLDSHPTEVYTASTAAPYRKPPTGTVMRGVHRPTQIGWMTASGGEVVLARHQQGTKRPGVRPYDAHEHVEGLEFDGLASAAAQRLQAADNLLSSSERMAAERRAAPKLQIAAVTQPVPAAEGLLTPRTNALHKVASGLALSADELATLRTANTGPSPSASTRSDGRRATFSDSAHEPIRRNSASIELPSQEQPPPPAPPPPPLEQQQLGYRVLLQQQPRQPRQAPTARVFITRPESTMPEPLFAPKDADQDALIQTIADSARVRMECASASEVIGRDFARDFSPADHPFRRPARSLVIKSNNINARLQAQLTALEDAAWSGIRAASSGVSDRDTVIAVLQGEVRGCDSELRTEIGKMRESVKKQLQQNRREFDMLSSAMAIEIRNAEEELAPMRKHIQQVESRLRYVEATVKDAATMAAVALENERLAKREVGQLKVQQQAEIDKWSDQVKKLKSELASSKKENSILGAERDKLVTEVATLKQVIGDLNGDQGSAATRLRAAEAEGGNLRALATAACDKLEALEKVAEQLRTDLNLANRYVLERDQELLELNFRLKNAIAEKREVDALRTCVIELQTVLKEALKAPTWKQSRQILYHESLRYVPTAPHGTTKEGSSAGGSTATGGSAGGSIGTKANWSAAKGMANAASAAKSMAMPSSEALGPRPPSQLSQLMSTDRLGRRLDLTQEPSTFGAGVAGGRRPAAELARSMPSAVPG
jgi:hypothetical protein